MGFEVGNPMFKNTTELTFPQGWIHSDEVMLGLGWVQVRLAQLTADILQAVT